MGRICRKGRFKAWSERKSEGVMDDESGESMELMEEVPLNAMQPNNTHTHNHLTASFPGQPG